jgi:hypothetical protein
MKRSATICVGVAIACWRAGSAGAITDGEKCESDKIKTAGKYSATAASSDGTFWRCGAI